MGRLGKQAVASLGAVAVIAGLAGIARADIVANNLDGSVDAVAEVMPLSVGGADSTTTLYINPANEDGKNGCNLTGSTILSVSVSSSAASVATVSPTSLTFTSCGSTKTLTVTPVSAGSTSISLTQTANNTGGTFDLAPATFTVNVSPPPNTAPTVSVTDVTPGTSYPKGSVPVAQCSVQDQEDGPSTFAATLGTVSGPYAADGIGSQEASCSYTDGGGLHASASATYAIVDPSAPSIQVEVDPDTPDGDNGWYVSDVSVDWTVTDLDSPSSLVLTGCADQPITADQALTTYDCSATSAGGSAGPATVSIKRDASAPNAPSGSIDPLPNAAGWNHGPVMVSFTDNGDDGPAGVAGCTADQPVGSDTDALGVTVDGTCTDNAGNTSTETPVTLKIDSQAPNPPEISVDPIPNLLGWNNSNALVTFTAAGDHGASGVADCTDPVLVDTETAGQVVSGTCTDNAGNTSTEASVTVKLDKSAPNAPSASVAPAPNAAGWNNTDPTVTFTGNGDNGPSDISICGPTTTVTSETAGQVVSGTCTDNAGNTSDPASVTVKLDKHAPENVAITGGPAAGSYYFGSVPAAPSGCTATDPLSGLAGCVVTGYDTDPGTHTLTATATDRAGNTATATRAYTVLHWNLTGFYQPVDMTALNTVKGGSTVPLKFEAFAAAELTDPAIVSSFQQLRVSCTTLGAVEDAIEVTTTGGTSLRYDSTAGQFIQNWQTPRLAGACYRVTLTLDDGSFITANFKLR